MRISQLVQMLNKIKKQRGNLNILVADINKPSKAYPASLNVKKSIQDEVIVIDVDIINDYEFLIDGEA